MNAAADLDRFRIVKADSRELAASRLLAILDAIANLADRADELRGDTLGTLAFLALSLFDESQEGEQ